MTYLNWLIVINKKKYESISEKMQVYFISLNERGRRSLLSILKLQ